MDSFYWILRKNKGRFDFQEEYTTYSDAEKRLAELEAEHPEDVYYILPIV